LGELHPIFTGVSVFWLCLLYKSLIHYKKKKYKKKKKAKNSIDTLQQYIPESQRGTSRWKEQVGKK